jgi:chromosomal replication initiation ATPase DnaA
MSTVSISDNPDVCYPLHVEGVLIGRFTKSQLALMRTAIDEKLAACDINYEWESIIQEVCRAFRLTRQEIFERGRRIRVAWPRQCAMYFIYEHTDMSLKEVGRIFGKDHGTVIHACDRVKQLRDANVDGKEIRAVEAALIAQTEQRKGAV